MSQKLDSLNKRIVFTGGGSGGHTSAAQAILQGILKKYPQSNDQILYIGGRMGMEGEKDGRSIEQKRFENTDINFVTIRSGKLQRYFSIDSIKKLFGILGGIIDAWKELSKFKPDIIISTGGFVSVPVCFVGWIKKIPIYIHEQTAAVGLANKISAKFATKIFIAFKSSTKYFPQGKSIHVGNPIRPEIFKSEPTGDVVNAIQKMQADRPNLPILLFTGGGQGSHKINITVRQMIRYLIEEFQIIIITGNNSVNRDFDVLEKEWKKLPKGCIDRFYTTKFMTSEELGYVLRNIDIHIGRAGANFVYEMGVLKIPSIFIPIPWVTHNEQEKNAQTMVDLGLAEILPEGELTAERLFIEVKKMRDAIRAGGYNVKETSEIFPLDAVERVMAGAGV